MSKPYRSLADIYANSAYKPVPKPPRQKIIGEDVQILFKADGDEKSRIVGYVNDKMADQLERTIANKSGGVFKIVDDILCDCGWKENCEGTGSKEYVRKILGPVMTAIEDTSDVNNLALKQFHTNKKSQTAFLNDLINAAEQEQTFSALQPLMEASDEAFSNSEDTVFEIADVNPSIANVGVGKGEIAITMFSNGRKGKVGDLYFPGFGEVEVKGVGGRPGKTGNAFGAVKALPKLLKDKKGENINTAEQVRAKHALLGKARNKLKTYLVQSVMPVVNDRQVEEINRFIDNIEQLEQNLDKTPDTSNLSQLKRNFQNDINRGYIPAGKIKSVDSRLEMFFNTLSNYIDSKNNKIAGSKKQSSTEVFSNFFLHDWGLDKKDIIQGFLEISSEANYDEKAFREGLGEILTPDLLRDLAVNRNYFEMKTIIAALQIAQYREHEGFKVILFMNNDLIALPLMPKGDNVKERFLETYRLVRKFGKEGILSYDAGIDSRSKGVSIELKS